MKHILYAVRITVRVLAILYMQVLHRQKFLTSVLLYLNIVIKRQNSVALVQSAIAIILGQIEILTDRPWVRLEMYEMWDR
jgi:hypothetical protein